ncbi:MAG TPA: hypothetical protein VG711_04870 [Phycisphaerales bacterium]|nr:hypothetical protein [Phycisphaerales bacterium]
MPNITPRQPARVPMRPPPLPPKSKTRILLVRQPVKSVRTEERSTLPIRLALGITTSLGIVAVVWLMGYLGFHLGFAPMIRLPDLLGEPGEGLATGVMMLISMPRVVMQAGLDQPAWLMLAFGLIAIPAASLGAIKPTTPGGPKVPRIVTVFSYVGAIFAALTSMLLVAWTASPFRRSMLAPLPIDLGMENQSLGLPDLYAFESWLRNLHAVSGLDVLAVIIASLWVVVVLRLTIPLWLKALSSSFTFFALVTVTVTMAMSNAASTHMDIQRSVSFREDGSLDTRLFLGDTRRHMAQFTIDGRIAKIELRETETRSAPSLFDPDAPAPPPGPSAPPIEVLGTQSIVEFIRAHGTRDR